MIEFTLPVPPSANRYWRHNRGITHRSQEAKAYITLVQMEGLARGVKPLSGDVTVWLDVFRPTRRGDTDNFCKVLIDSLRGVAFADDEQVAVLIAKRFDAPAGTTKAAKEAREKWRARVVVRIERIAAEI